MPTTGALVADAAPNSTTAAVMASAPIVKRKRDMRTPLTDFESARGETRRLRQAYEAQAAPSRSTGSPDS